MPLAVGLAAVGAAWGYFSIRWALSACPQFSGAWAFACAIVLFPVVWFMVDMPLACLLGGIGMAVHGWLAGPTWLEFVTGEQPHFTVRYA
ncbi:MAG: hypothetical protein FJX72_11680 [Armatimonadetes bacterium]|nr:hypothetical protein [Armatimonadota bacterium]